MKKHIILFVLLFTANITAMNSPEKLGERKRALFDQVTDSILKNCDDKDRSVDQMLSELTTIKTLFHKINHINKMFINAYRENQTKLSNTQTIKDIPSIFTQEIEVIGIMVQKIGEYITTIQEKQKKNEPVSSSDIGSFIGHFKKMKL